MKRRDPAPPRVTDAELAVLKALWGRGPSTIRELAEQLYPNGDTSEYATVQKLLERLEGKSCVRRKLKGRTNVFSATVDREGLIDRQLRSTAEKLCEGSMTPLLTHLVNTTQLADDELDALRELVRRHDRRGRR